MDIYSRQCDNLIIIEPRPYEIQVIKCILFGIRNIIEYHHEKIMLHTPYIFGKFYIFISKITEFYIPESAIECIRPTLVNIMNYGEKYLVKKGGIEQLKQITDHYVLRCMKNDLKMSIKDIMV